MTQKEALDLLKMGHNVFLTGAAGSGKTFVLNKYVDLLKKEGVGIAVTASTGIAATHLGGMTIHSWSGLGIRDSLPPEAMETLESRQYLWKRYESAKVLVIDEVSMLHHFRFDLLDRLCRSFKRKDQPFGGLQVILSGDFFQLPPVSRFGEPTPEFIFKSNAWKDMNLKVCYLEEEHRQNDESFLQVLSDIRNDEVCEQTIERLESRRNKEPVGMSPTKLYSHNVDVDLINQSELSKIIGEGRIYRMSEKGSPALIEALKKSCLAHETLSLKIGAKVMFVKNNFEKGYANGTLGEIVNFNMDGPVVEVRGGRRITATPESWTIEEDGKKKVEVMQIPLRLAWAITVHKSQGMSLDAAEIDLSKSFAFGMGYVALSRVRSLDGLKLLGLNPMALRVNQEILEFDKELRKLSDKARREIEIFSVKDLENIHSEFMKLVSPLKGGKKTKEKIEPHQKTGKFISEGFSIAEIAEARNITEGTVFSHVEKLIEESKNKSEGFSLQALSNHLDARDFKDIINAFEKEYKKSGDYKLSPVKSALCDRFSYEDLRFARLFLLVKE